MGDYLSLPSLIAHVVSIMMERSRVCARKAGGVAAGEWFHWGALCGHAYDSPRNLCVCI